MQAKLKAVPIDELNRSIPNTIMESLGMKFTGIGEDFVQARMPVDHRTHQVYGLLHGGASVVLAETLGSVGAMLTVDPSLYRCVGIEVNANHISSVKTGFVTGTAKPVHVGKATQVWEIRITNDEDNKLVCVSRLTLAIIALRT